MQPTDVRRKAGYSYIKRPPTLNARWPFGHQWHAGLSRQHSPASTVAGISEGMCIPQGECRPIPCRNPALRSGLRRGLGRTAHSAIGTRYGGSRGASAALDPGLRPCAYASSAPLPWRHPSRLRRHRVSPLVRYACMLVPPDAALRLPSLSLSLHCRWRAVLLAHSLTLMPTRAFHSADAMLLVLHRQSTRATSAAQRCSALRASRRRLSGDAGASSGAGSLMPHRHPSFLLQHRVSVPQSASIAARRPRRYASGWRAANQHGTQPDGASRSPTYPPLCDDGFAYRFPQNTHCFSSWTRRTATTNHCADILCRHSRLQGECRP